jgi:hypothetical protein
VSTDATPEILRALASELDHIDVRRERHSRASHDVLLPYMGTATWALRVDGDELYDAGRLARMRDTLESGELDDVFRVQASVLHCVALDLDQGVASGYLTPPSRACTAFYNLSAVESWRGAAERLHGGDVVFRPRYDWSSVAPLHDRYSWDESPLRYLHTCFLRRSSLEVAGSEPRPTLSETGIHRRGLIGNAVRRVRRPRIKRRTRELHDRGAGWKTEMYGRGPLVEKDVGSFLVRDAVQPSA